MSRLIVAFLVITDTFAVFKGVFMRLEESLELTLPADPGDDYRLESPVELRSKVRRGVTNGAPFRFSRIISMSLFELRRFEAYRLFLTIESDLS
jgi:hypothetical protein